MYKYTAPGIKALIEVIAFMHQLKKHKGSLFIYKKVNKDNYDLKSLLKNNIPLDSTLDTTYWISNFVIEYHPYIHIFHNRPRLSANSDLPVNQQLANLTADCEWLKAQMKYTPLARVVRSFKLTERQRKESQTYLARFYQVYRAFLFHKIFIVFPTHVQTADQLEAMLKSITAFRVKLISQLKNHDLISEQQTRYLWKVIVKGEQLCLHLFIVYKKQMLNNLDKDIHRIRNKQHLKEQINKTAEKLSMTINEPEIATEFTQDTAKDKRKGFNAYLKDYFKQDFWFPYYRISCKEPRKMLFGKGNNKDKAL